MQTFRFSKKQQPRTYTVFTIISIIVGIIVFWSLDNLKISSSLAYLMVTIISFISIMMSIKKANKTFEEIIIDGNKVSFSFASKIKNKIVKDLNSVILIEKEDLLEVKEKDSEVSIGVGYKNRIENSEILEELIKCFNVSHTDSQG